MKGVIDQYALGKGGTIRTDDDRVRKRVFLPDDWLVEGRWPRRKEAVEYEPHPQDGTRAILVRPAGVSVDAARTLQEAAERRRGEEERRASQQRTYRRVRVDGERFLNPYNFVRPLADPIPHPDRPETRLLGRFPPPPHDRDVALSGRLVCTITTCSPIFVSDSHEVEASSADREHRTYRFHRVPDGTGGEVPCIPASSLRGAVRSVFEAVTNSCWEHVAADRRLSRRIPAREANRLVPGRIERHADGWRLRRLEAAWVLRYRSRVGTRERPAGVERLQHGVEAYARLTREHHHRGFEYWNVEAIGTLEEVARGLSAEETRERVRRGHYFETGRNVDNKHDERFFFELHEPHLIPVHETVLEDYVRLLADYRDRHLQNRSRDPESQDNGIGGEQDPEPSRFLRPSTPVPGTVERCDGELVYARIEGSGQDREVRAIAPVSVPRLFYRKSLRDLFPAIDSVTPCSEVNRLPPAPSDGEEGLRLCPGCRTFGWVAKDAGRDAGSRAYRSRVRFGAARFPDEALEKTAHTLEILSSPKPTTVRFYLLPIGGDLRPQQDESRIDYDSGNVELRGRKMYRRRRAALSGDRVERSGQNRTIRDHLEADRTASFEVVFQNLAPVELGALLWALELEPGWAHRLGYGKPLGLGALRIEVARAEMFGIERYTGSEATAVLPRETLDALRRLFRTAMAAAHGQPFDELPNVADLRGILGSEPSGVAVMYPRLPPGRPQESFAWFVENRSRRGGHWLDLADADDGLPHDPATAYRDRHP